MKKSCAPPNARGRPKKYTKHYVTEEYPILDGDAKIIRTNVSGGYWSLSCWLKSEGKMLRRALGTRSFDKAIELGRNKYYEIMGDIRAGNRIFSKTTVQLVDEFLEHKLSEANAGMITHGRVGTIRTVLNKWFLSYIGKNTNLEKLKQDDFQRYYIWRRERSPKVKNCTLGTEKSAIISVFNFGIQKGYLQPNQKPVFPKASHKRGNIERRDFFTEQEWEQIYRSFRRWVKNAGDEKEREQRKFIRDNIIIMANTGLRPGEIRKLKWSMIRTYKSDQLNERKENQVHVEIQVPPDTKTGERTTVGRRGDIFDRIKSYSKHTKPDDWIFCDNDTGAAMSRKVYHKQWDTLMDECGIADLNKNISYYSLRHTYITFRLIHGTNAFNLSKNVGTSLKNIEERYSHVKPEMVKDNLTQDSLNQ